MSSNASLKKQLAETAAALRRAQRGFQQEAVERAIGQLRRAGTVRGALREGEIAPEFALEAADGRLVALPDLLDRGPVIVTFFRGGWCPYCSLTLQALQRSRGEIVRYGGEILAISLETPAENRHLARQLRIEFPLLSDPEGRVAHLFGVLYQVPPELVAAYREQGTDLPGRQGTHRWLLPLAATYLIDRDAMTRYAFVEADPAERADPSEIIAALERLRET